MNQITLHLLSFPTIPYRIVLFCFCFFFSISSCVPSSVVHALPASESLCGPMKEANSWTSPQASKWEYLQMESCYLHVLKVLQVIPMHKFETIVLHFLCLCSYCCFFWNEFSLNFCRNSTLPLRLSLNVISSITNMTSSIAMSTE